MKVLVIGLGQAGGKVVCDAIRSNVVDVHDTILINSTEKDFPADYTGEKIIIAPKNSSGGSGRERHIAKAYLVNSIKNNAFADIDFNPYSTVCLVSSVGGGSGSGSAPLFANYISKVLVKNCHLYAITSFLTDVREMANTVDFFKEIDSNIIVHTINNAAFLTEADGNRTRAEELANQEFIKQFKILTGSVLIPGDQNIDDTDIIKLSNTYGYSCVEYKELDKSLGESSDYDKIIKKMIYESKSIKSEDPSATKLGVILNLNPSSQAALADVFSVLKDNYGIPYECFQHIQWDEKKEYIAYIASGMKLPIDELNKVYEKYLEQTKLINKQEDSFFDSIKEMSLLEEDKQFDMIRPVKKGMSTEDFLANL